MKGNGTRSKGRPHNPFPYNYNSPHTEFVWDLANRVESLKRRGHPETIPKILGDARDTFREIFGSDLVKTARNLSNALKEKAKEKRWVKRLKLFPMGTPIDVWDFEVQAPELHQSWQRESDLEDTRRMLDDYERWSVPQHELLQAQDRLFHVFPVYEDEVCALHRIPVTIHLDQDPYSRNKQIDDIVKRWRRFRVTGQPSLVVAPYDPYYEEHWPGNKIGAPLFKYTVFRKSATKRRKRDKLSDIERLAFLLRKLSERHETKSKVPNFDTTQLSSTTDEPLRLESADFLDVIHNMPGWTIRKKKMFTKQFRDVWKKLVSDNPRNC